MGPIDYSLDVATPFASALQGYQAGAAIRNDQAQQQQQQQALKLQQQMQTDLHALSSNKNATGADYASVMTKYPQLSEQLTKSWSTLDGAQRQSKLQQGTQAYAAILSGKPDVAETLFRERAVAARNSGMEDAAKQSETMADLIKLHPESARTSIAMSLAAEMGPDKFATTFGQLGSEQRANDLAPSGVRKAEAEATTAEVAAGNAPTKTELDNQKAEQDIKTAEAQRNIADLNVQISQANSETQRGQLILERDKWQAELDKSKANAGQGVQDKIDNISQTLETVKSVMSHPGLSKGTGMGGDFAAWFNGTDAADFRAQVETLKSQQFLSSVATMKGTGALSDAEGARLERAIASLDTKQSPGAFKNALGVIKTTLEKAQAKLIASGQAPTSGGTVVLDHPIYGKIKDGDVNRLMSKYPGATREQVLNYLKQSSAKPGGASGGY